MASIAELQQQIASVDAAIAKAERAQAITTDGVSISRANLDSLYRRRDQLQSRLSRKQNGRFARTRVTGAGGRW
jgi:septal ring factor EnvC (AmiA/AmiB activator)